VIVRTLFLVAGVLLSAVGIFAVKTHADHEEDERVEKLMEKTHEGKRSPYGQLRQIVEGPGAPWPVIEQTVAGFDPMVRALLDSKNADIKDSADGYVDAVKELTAAVKRRDAKGVRKGFDSLKQSCGDCHFKGGVGGELDD
jgi:hypothetical protein